MIKLPTVSLSGLSLGRKLLIVAGASIGLVLAGSLLATAATLSEDPTKDDTDDE